MCAYLHTKTKIGAPGWLSWKSHATLDLRVMSSSPSLGVDINKQTFVVVVVVKEKIWNEVCQNEYDD